MKTICISRTTRLAVGAGLAVCALALSPAVAQTYNEVEPNESRATATPIPSLPSGPGMAPGETIGGISTANSTTGASPANSDYYRIRIDTAPLAIYKQRLTATSGGTNQNYTVSIRGYSQGSDGTINTTSDAAVLSTSTLTPPRYIQWYGFGKGEFVNHRIDGVSGTSGTTQPYTLTLTRETVMPQVASTTFSAGPITISSLTSGATNTDFWVYDADLNPVSTFGNDDNTVLGGGPGTGSLSIATRTLTPGTYYVAISTFNLANDQASPFDERSSTLKNVWSDPNGLSNNATSTAVNVSIHISDGSQTELVNATKVDPFDVVWVRFTVGAAANIQVTPTVTPDPVVPGTNATLRLAVTPAPTPPNTITSATFDLTNLGGTANTALFDDGLHGDGAAGDSVYGLIFPVPLTVAPGTVPLAYSVSDSGGRTTGGSEAVTIAPVTPPNDDCGNARVLTDGMLPLAATVGINLATADQAVGCATSGITNNGVWYTYTPSINCVLSMRETGSRDALFAVYTGGCGFGATEVFCEPTETDANFPLQAGVTYHILVGTPGSASTGANDVFVLSFACGATPAPPINDTCSSAIVLIPSASFNVSQVGGATEDNFTSCITTFGVQGGRNGVWYTYSTGAQDQLARVWRANDGQTALSLAIYTGPCIGAELTCLNLGTATPGTGVLLRRNTTYYFLVHRRTGYAAADATFQFGFNIENYPNVDNSDCATAEVVPGLPFTDSVTNILAFDDGPLNDCPTALVGDAAGGSGVWYVYTPTEPTIVKVENLNSGTQNAAVAAFEGSCGGTRIMCSLTDTDTSGSNTFRARPGVSYYILVTRQDSGLPSGTATFEISITGVPVPPAPGNDECASATVIPGLPFADALSNAFASDEPFKAVCARGTITTTTRNSVWYRYTNGPAFAAAVMSESTGQDAIIAAYKGACGSLIPVMCTDEPENNNYLYMEPGTTYYIMVAHAFDQPSQGAETLAFTMDVSPSLVAPPANDACATATPVRRFPFTTNALPLAAAHDADPSCSTANVAQGTNGVWYAIPGYNGFTLSVTETDTPDVMYALFQGACGGFEVACQTTDTNRTFPLLTGDTYYLLVARQSNSDFTLGATPPALTITAAAGTTGACCTGSGCVQTAIEGCTSGFIPNAACDAGNPVACCPANFNQIGGVTVQDIFDFLAAYFAQAPAADFNGTGTVTVQDIFDFLAAYFAGCT